MSDFCIALTKEAWQTLLDRLKANSVTVEEGPVESWGAHSTGTSVYFRDPEGNLIDAKHYDEDDRVDSSPAQGRNCG